MSKESLEHSMFSLEVLPSPAVIKAAQRPRSGSDPGAFTVPKPITTTTAGRRKCVPHRASRVKFTLNEKQEEEYITRPGSSTIRFTRRGSEPAVSEPGVPAIKEEDTGSSSSESDTSPLGLSPDSQRAFLDFYPSRNKKRNSVI